MCYESDTDAGLSEDSRLWLESVLDERFGYSLCLYHHNVVPGAGMVLLVTHVGDMLLDQINLNGTLFSVNQISINSLWLLADVAEAVSHCIQQSRTVLLVPTSPPCGPGSDILKNILATPVARKSRIVVIKPETTEAQRSRLLPEVQAADCVTWSGTSSMTLSSSFLKQLRCFLPAPQHPPQRRLLADV